ncbi:MAG: hypothetical protein IJI68_13610 [Eggerthellaceae bacterium]|nr:hypothetical protein [Eggerthellaceae bacterium]
MLLVFALVFWSSFRVECLAFAAINLDPLANHADGTLSNLEIWQVADPDNIDWANAGKDDLKQRVAVVKTGEGEHFEAPELKLATQGRMQFVVIPDWGGDLKVTYTDGVDDELVFPDDVHEHLSKGSKTPSFEIAENYDGKRYGYSFAGWLDDEGRQWPYDSEKGYAPVAEKVEKDVVYAAQWEGNEHTITYKDSDGNEIAGYTIRFGDTIPVPSGTSIDEESWIDGDGEGLPADRKLNKDKDLTYTPKAGKTYTIKWYDSDNSLLGSDEVKAGEVPSREGPSKNPDDEYTYLFSHWDPVPYAADKDQEYRAVYSQNLRLYTVTWNDGYKGDLYSEQYYYGDTPSYSGTVTRPDDDNYTYEFAGWNPTPTPVAGDASYEATWTVIPRQPSEPTTPPSDDLTPNGLDQDEPNSLSQAASGALSFIMRPAVAYADEPDDNTVLVANDDLLEWKVTPIDDSASATVTFEQGVATLTGVSPGKVEVSCKLKDDGNGAVAYELPEGMSAADFEMKFQVTIVYVSSLELYRSDTNALVGGGIGQEVPPEGDGSKEHPLLLTDEQKSGFGLTAKANVSTIASEGGSETFESTPENTLSMSSGKLLSDLRWSVLDGELNEITDPTVASITQGGVLTVAVGEGAPSQYAVRCTSANGENGDYSEYVYFGDWSQDLLQGEDRHQDQLTVVVQVPKFDAGTESESSDSSASASTEGDAAESADNVTEPGELNETPAGNDTPESTDSEASSEGEEAKNYREITTVYDKDLKNVATGKQLERNSKTYSMTLPTGAHPNGELVSVAGFGTTLSLLLDDAGVSLEKQKSIEYLEFTNAEAVTTRVYWTDLVNASHAETSYVIVATQATVLGAQDGSAAAASDGAADSTGNTKLLDNTRFQIMFDQSDAAPALTEVMAALRWVNTITVHMKGIEEEEGDESLRPTINYQPVPKGVTALLTVVPPESVGSQSFGYKWERWTEKSGAWEEVATNVEQTIHVPTDDEHIGNYYRVSVIVDEGASKPSKPVQIKEGNGMVVQLDYQPPFAGGWASFTSHIIGADENDPNIKYRWEQSTDGCKTWTEIPNETGKTLRVKTNPITPGSDDGGGATVLTYIRVVAVLGSNSGVSGPQLLTVQVGDDPDGHDSTENEGNETPDSEKSGESSKPSPSPNLPDAEDLDVDEDFDDGDDGDDYDFEDEDDGDDGDGDDEEEYVPERTNQVAPTQELPENFKPIAKPEIVVDKKMAKEIKEKANEAKTPGARWTKISATPEPEEVRRVLASNPFAPLTAPFALGLTAAGVVEKLLAFRRQIK